MKKSLIIAMCTAILSLCVATPAFAAELNTYEQAVYNEFKAEVEQYRSILTDEIADQYLTEAETALLAVDLSKTACAEHSQAVKDVDKLFKDNNVASRSDLHRLLPQALAMTNKVANKYGMNVTVDSKFYAHVSTTGANGTSTVIVDTKPLVRQTGFDAGQSVGVGLMLVGSFAAVLVTAVRVRATAQSAA